MKRPRAVRKTTPRAPIVTPTPMAADGESLCDSDEAAGDDPVGVGEADVVYVKVVTIVVGTYEVVKNVSLNVGSLGRLIAGSSDVNELDSGVFTLENARSLIFPALTNEKAWPG